MNSDDRRAYTECVESALGNNFLIVFCCVMVCFLTQSAWGLIALFWLRRCEFGGNKGG